MLLHTNIVILCFVNCVAHRKTYFIQGVADICILHHAPPLSSQNQLPKVASSSFYTNVQINFENNSWITAFVAYASSCEF
jgi:hypothetical protein